MKRIKSLSHIIAITALIALLLFYPSLSAKLAIEGFSVWFLYVLPSLFPFFFICGILNNLNLAYVISKKLGTVTEKVFHISGISCYSAILSYISGYPIGAKTTENLYISNYIEKDEALCCSLLSSTSGLTFIIGTAGGIILSVPLYGVLIYISHIIGAMITAFVFRPKKIKNTISYNNAIKNLDKTLYDLMFDSIIAILIVGGYISLFYVFYGVIANTGLLSLISKPLDKMFSCFGNNLGEDFISGIFECTQGIKRLSAKIENKKIASIFSCALISFGGISINMQNLSFLAKTDIKKTTYLFGKVVHTIISTAILSLVFYIF